MTSKRLKFASEHVDPMLAGRKWATIRHDLDIDLSPGDRVALVDAGREEVFARATVGDIYHVDAEFIVDADFEGHRSYRSTAELLSELRRYYPDAELTPSTRLSFIQFQRVQQAGDYDLRLDPREPRPEEVAHRGE